MNFSPQSFLHLGPWWKIFRESTNVIFLTTLIKVSGGKFWKMSVGRQSVGTHLVSFMDEHSNVSDFTMCLECQTRTSSNHEHSCQPRGPCERDSWKLNFLQPRIRNEQEDVLFCNTIIRDNNEFNNNNNRTQKITLKTKYETRRSSIFTSQHLYNCAKLEWNLPGHEHFEPLPPIDF